MICCVDVSLLGVTSQQCGARVTCRCSCLVVACMSGQLARCGGGVRVIRVCDRMRCLCAVNRTGVDVVWLPNTH